MKIALINENSQAPKNALLFELLIKTAEPYGHTVANYGRYSAEDPHERSYVQAGLLTAILINSGAADLVITGCGTGEGAMMACNAFPNVICGLVNDALDATLLARVNDANAIAMPYAKGFGWGAELNIEYAFEKLFAAEFGSGYPEEWAAAEKHNKRILDQVKNITHRSMAQILKDIDQDFLKETVSADTFTELFYSNCKDNEVSEYIKELLQK
ncbi:MAG: RpiB/LacA/LacB family sugar-phosphate isomerase [Eubacteriales bacterium]|nr:RpiB/LacA/LacB family sugar-phosphate isomerase [Eubacteriales bacterium]